jgi:glycerol kinase
VRATLEAIAFQTVDAVRAMDATADEPLRELRADGGASVNGWLMQFQADVLGVPGRPAAGARDDGARRRVPGGRRRRRVQPGTGARALPRRVRYEPLMSADERASRHAEWARGVERARGWASG